jgi:exosortase/archaeosortase family protein
LGNTLNLPTKELFVAEACSGIQSAFTMCFIALLIVVWKRRPLILAPVYLIAALVFAVLANTIRVLTIALAEYSFQYDLTSGWQHDMVGYLALLLCGGALLSFDSLCEMLFHPTRVPMHKRKLNPLALGWNYLLGFSDQTRGEDGYGWIDYNAVGSDRVGDGHASQRTDQQVVPSRPKKPTAPAWGMLGAAGVAGVLMLGGIALGRTDSRPIVSKEALLFDPPEGFLDGQVGILTLGGREVVRNGTDERLGLHADVWECGYDAGKGQVALSQPYVGWHELCVCYEALEWELLRRYNLPVPQGKPVALGEFEQGGKYGYLFFTAIDSDGSIPTPPSYTLFGRLVAPFYPLVTDDFAEISGSAQTVMLQFWTVRDEPLETTEKSAIAKSVAEMRQLASQQIVESVPPTAPALPSAE